MGSKNQALNLRRKAEGEINNSFFRVKTNFINTAIFLLIYRI